MDQKIEYLQVLIDQQNGSQTPTFKDVALNIDTEIKLDCLQHMKPTIAANYYHVDPSWIPRPYMFEQVKVDYSNPIYRKIRCLNLRTVLCMLQSHSDEGYEFVVNKWFTTNSRMEECIKLLEKLKCNWESPKSNIVCRCVNEYGVSVLHLLYTLKEVRMDRYEPLIIPNLGSV